MLPVIPKMNADSSPPVGIDEPSGLPGMAFFPFLIALALLALLTVWPAIATDGAGRADHLMALLLLWAMCAGFVRGVGFVPVNRVPRWLLSTVACLLALALAVLRAACCGQLEFLFKI